MISKRLRRLLIRQVGSELKAQQAYLGMALFFDRRSLTRWAKLFRDQSAEEGQHAAKIMAFLTDNEVTYDLPRIRAATTRYKSPARALQAALESELRVTRQFNAMARAAMSRGDHRSLQFLGWFIAEQVEEERTMRGLLDLIASGINLFAAEPLLEAMS